MHLRVNNFGDPPNYSSSAFIKYPLLCFITKYLQTNDSPSTLSYNLYMVLTTKSYHANT